MVKRVKEVIDILSPLFKTLDKNLNSERFMRIYMIYEIVLQKSKQNKNIGEVSVTRKV